MARRALKATPPAAKTVTASCFGAVMSVDTSDAQGVRLAKAFQVFNDSLAAAIDATRDKVQTDRIRQAVYQTSNRANPIAAPNATGLSLLDDCGLPLVNQFGSFLDNLHSEVSASSLPFVGFGTASRYGRDTVAPLWTTSPLSVLAKVIPFTFGLLNSHYQLINYLARLNSSDDIWQAPQHQQWFNQFGGPLKTYMTDMFAGRFRDRNGTAVSFDLASSSTPPTSLDPKQISPQLAGGIVSALVEYLGDQLYQVPFYSQNILATYRQQRDDASVGQSLQTLLDKLTSAVKAGKISADDPFAALGIPKANSADLAVVFDRIAESGKDTPVVASALARMVLAKIGQLDAALLAQPSTSSRGQCDRPDQESDECTPDRLHVLQCRRDPRESRVRVCRGRRHRRHARCVCERRRPIDCTNR